MARAIFFGILLLLMVSFFFMNYFTISRILQFLSKDYRIYAAVIMFLMIPVSGILMNTIGNRVTRSLFNFSLYYSVFIMYAFIIAAIAFGILRLTPVDIKPIYEAFAIVTIPLILILVSSISYNAIDIKTIEVNTHKDVDDVRIVQLSDIHISDTIKDSRIKEIVYLTNAQKPDFVAITGDLLDRPTSLAQDKIELLNSIDSDIYFIFGNHDFYLTEEYVTDRLKSSKLKILRNESAERGNIAIHGIDDSEDKGQVKKALDSMEIDKDKFNLLLYHRPYGVQAAEEKGIDLMLSGHTHSGQIFPFNIVIDLMYKYPSGTYSIGDDLKLHVNQGTNLWGPKLRMFSKNEITVIDIKGKE